MADRQDGAMIVQLAQWGSAMGLEDAMHAVWADDFDPEAASAAAVLALDSRGLTLAEAAPATTGQVRLADGSQGDFEVIQLPVLS